MLDTCEQSWSTIVESMEWLDAACGSQRARYALCPETGRKHQLRVHMTALGAPIDGEPLYSELDATALPRARLAGDWRAPLEDYSRPLQLLARALSFQDPFSSKLRLRKYAGPGNNVEVIDVARAL